MDGPPSSAPIAPCRRRAPPIVRSGEDAAAASGLDAAAALRKPFGLDDVLSLTGLFAIRDGRDGT